MKNPKNTIIEKKISLVFHPSYYEALEDGEFTQQEKGDMLDALCRFQFYGEMPEFTNPKYKMFWKLVIPNINTSVNRYKAAVENGKKGGVPKGTEPWNKGKKNEPKANQTTNQIAKQDIDNDKEKEKENDNNIEIDKKNKIEKQNKIEFDTNEVGVEDEINNILKNGFNFTKDEYSSTEKKEINAISQKEQQIINTEKYFESIGLNKDEVNYKASKNTLSVFEDI